MALTVAFWPAFKGSTSMTDILDQMPQGLVKAFGMEDFGTAAGYLRGNLYALFVPLLLVGAGIGFANSLTASEEDSGRFEILLAQPVSHRAVFFGRAVAVFAWVCLLTLVTAAIQLVADPIVGPLGPDRPARLYPAAVRPLWPSSTPGYASPLPALGRGPPLFWVWGCSWPLPAAPWPRSFP